MNKNKSKAAYTNKWLNRNKRFWHEAPMKYSNNKVIVIDKKDAPKIVIERVKEINRKRGCTSLYMIDDDPVDRLVNVIQLAADIRKQKEKKKLKKLGGDLPEEVETVSLSEIFKDDD